IVGDLEESTPAPAVKPKAAVTEGLSNSELRTLKKTLQSTDRKMATLRNKIDDAHERLHTADPTDFVALGDIQAEIDSLQSQLDDLELVWLETAELLGE
ncbi:MAG: ABC transporter ATP-binding protein, partial [Eggerthellaceae bacterium]|nr:ABC transporter ATP-binding protein [Eggerthellaceae bacterium]